MNGFVAFDAVLPRVIQLFDGLESPFAPGTPALYVVRDLRGKVRLSLSDRVEPSTGTEEWLQKPGP